MKQMGMKFTGEDLELLVSKINELACPEKLNSDEVT